MTLLGLVLLALSVVTPQAGNGGALEREARQIEAMLIAPCCWSQPVAQHQSEASESVKRHIRTLLAAGKTRREVLDAFAAEYGDRILAEPPARGFGRLLYIALPLAFVLSAAALVVFVRRASARRAPAAAPVGPPPAADDRYAAQLDEELRDMD